MKFLKKLAILCLKQLDLGSAIAVRLTKITGKSNEPIHPKHFLTQKPWYIDYIESSDTVLDLGCGNGQHTIKAAKYCKEATGVDIDNQLLKIANETVRIRKINNVTFRKANLEERLKFPDNQFNKIIFLDVLEHLENRDQILKEIRRVLEPNGLLIIGVPNNQTSWKKLQRSVGFKSFSDPDHKTEFSKEQIVTFLNKHDFSVQNFGYGSFDTPFRGLFDIIGGFSISLYRILSDWRKNRARYDPKEASGFEIVCRLLK